MFFSKIYDIFGFSDFLYLLQITQYNFFHLNPFSYWKYFSSILSFCSYSIGENEFEQSSKPLRKINKSNTKVFTHYRIVYLYSINICFIIFVSYELFNLFWNMFNSKAVKVWCYFHSHMSSYWFKLIKIYYICLILWFRSVISWINS